MSTYIALLRGINIGGHHLLPMRGLVGVLERAGCEQVRTYIQSGNAVFRTSKKQPRKIAEEIRAGILESYGFKPGVLLLGVPELMQAIGKNPFQTVDGRALHFFFLESRPKKPDLNGLAAIKTKTEEFRLHRKIFYLYAPDGIGRSRLAVKIEKGLGVLATGRNWNTVSKLLAMVKADQS